MNIDVRGPHPIVIIGLKTYNFALEEDIQAFCWIEMQYVILDDTTWDQLRPYIEARERFTDDGGADHT
jgi:hypothetical protein